MGAWGFGCRGLSPRAASCLLLLQLLPQDPRWVALWDLFPESNPSNLSLRPARQCKEMAWPFQGPPYWNSGQMEGAGGGRGRRWSRGCLKVAR